MKDQLESLIKQMHEGGILYGEAVREFKKCFVLHVINHKTVRQNQCKAARELGMHRNTFSRTTRELGLVRHNGRFVDRRASLERKPIQSAAMGAAAGVKQA